MSTYFALVTIFYGVLDTSVKSSVYKHLLKIILMQMDGWTNGRVDGWIITYWVNKTCNADIMANNRHWSTVNLG